jgi:hypothetical protein
MVPLLVQLEALLCPCVLYTGDLFRPFQFILERCFTLVCSFWILILSIFVFLGASMRPLEPCCLLLPFQSCSFCYSFFSSSSETCSTHLVHVGALLFTFLLILEACYVS